MGKPKKPKRKLSAYNKHMSREMKRGRTFKQAVASWKGGNKKSSPKKRTSNKNTTGGRKKVGGFNTQKIFKIVRIAALALPAAGIITSGLSSRGKMKAASMAYFGVNPDDGSFKLGRLAAGWLPYLASIGVTYGIPKIAGLIRGL